MGTGGRRAGAGRPKGSKSKATIELQEAAQQHTAKALEALLKVATKGKSESARVAAACALLDRGHGKPRQGVEATLPPTAGEGIAHSESMEAIKKLMMNGSDSPPVH